MIIYKTLSFGLYQPSCTSHMSVCLLSPSTHCISFLCFRVHVNGHMLGFKHLPQTNQYSSLDLCSPLKLIAHVLRLWWRNECLWEIMRG